jgi:threonine synthase
MQTNYESTRNANHTASAKQAILEGICRDGGLYVLRDLPDLSVDLDQILNQNYLENAVYVLSKLLGDYTKEELEECVKNAYTSSFSNEAITPVRKVDDVYVLELFHGPTSAFKDVALTLLPQLMSVALRQNDAKALILTATSGDTGKAALSGFQDVDRIAINVFYPDGKVSAVQQAQMATQKGNNVHVYGIEGNFDDAQSQVKKLFLDEELNKQAKEKNILLSSANSINVGRLVPQIVYYFDAYKQLINQGVIKKGDKVTFSVPTGNFGDVLAGYYAYLMGLPVKKFLVASNANNVLTDFLKTGVYDRNREFIKTISPSMDILISSNLERLLYYMSGRDNEKVAGWMKDLADTGRFDVGSDVLEKIQELFEGDYVDDDKTRAIIDETYKKSGIVLDPHTAIGYGVAKKLGEGVVVSLATASPYKFSQDVLAALGKEQKDEWQAMKDLAQINTDAIPQGLAELESLPVLHDAVVSVEGMKKTVADAMAELA